MPAKAHAVVEVGIRTVRFLNPNFRMHEMRLRQHRGRSGRSDDRRNAWMARRRTETTVLSRRVGASRSKLELRSPFIQRQALLAIYVA
jgi:hypothetical protein